MAVDINSVAITQPYSPLNLVLMLAYFLFEIHTNLSQTNEDI